MERKNKTFLSHNSKDKPIVKKIARWLDAEAKIPVWLDEWNLIPGAPWMEEIEKALDECRCCVVFLGPSGIGPWHNEEMRVAFDNWVSDKSRRVIPVLLPGAKLPGKKTELPRFLRRLGWVEFKRKWDEPEALHRLKCGIKGEIPKRDYAGKQEGVCPFRGLRIFREEDREFFFGRDVVVQRLLDKLADSRFLSVTGPSGSGKSSIVQAGLIPYLRSHAEVALFQPGERPVEELAFALRRCYPQKEKDKPPVEQLRKRLHEGGDRLHLIAREMLEFSDKEKLLIVIDQFEELFAQTKNEESRLLFISLLLEAVDAAGGPVTVILTLRSDFIGKCAFYKDLNMFINDHFVQVEPMSMAELRQAIEEPALLVGLDFEEGLVNRILEDVKNAPGELPLLEHALLELYEHREGSRLSLKAYDTIGGIAGALVNRAETEYNRLNHIEKEILRKMFVLRLIQPGEGTEDTRRRATKEELLSIGRDSNKKFFGGPGGDFSKKPPGRRRQVEEVLKQWIDARLLTASRDTSRNLILIDVAHEALIRKWDRIGQWMAEGREAARLTGILRQAALEWRQNDRSPGFLYQEARLVQMEELARTHAGDLTADEIEFIEAGVQQRQARELEKEERRKKELQAARELAAAKDWALESTRDLSTAQSKTIKRTRLIISVIFLSLIAVTYLFYNSNKNEKTARRQLAVNYWDNARQSREKDQLFSMHLLAEAVSINPDTELQKIILFDMNNYWNNLPLHQVLQHEGSVIGTKFNDDKTRILTWSKDGTARIWNSQTGKAIGKKIVHEEAVRGATFNADGTRILTWGRVPNKRTFWVRCWHAQTCTPIGREINEDSISVAKFNADGTRILTCNSSGRVRLWDVETGEVMGKEMSHIAAVIGATFNKNETRTLTWSDDGTAQLWDAETGKAIGQKMAHEGIVLGASFNADETRILTWSRDGTAHLWHAETGKPMGQPMIHEKSVNGTIFNKDETKILTWSEDGTARLWDAKTGQPMDQPMIHEEAVWGATFNKDETHIMTWSWDGTARLWDAKTGQPMGQAMVYEGIVKSATFNADETRILTWSGDGTVRLWHGKAGKPIGEKMVHKGGVNGAIFNNDEIRVLTWADDGTARLWNIGVDWDFPKDKIKLQVWALTGTRFNTTTMEIEFLDADEWRDKKEEYMAFAKKHYKSCKYPKANVFRKLFPKEAEKIGIRK